MPALSQALFTARSNGVDRLDAQLLMLHALGRPAHDRAWLLAHDTDALSPAEQAMFDAGVQRRATGEPLAYITGHKEFFGLDLQVDARVLVPRPDTETLVEWALKVLDAASVRAAPFGKLRTGFVEAPTPAISVIDLGTGSGAIALALKHTRPGLLVSATDASVDTLAVARANAQRLQLDVCFSQRSWLEGVPDRYHTIVSNPPYIAAQDKHLNALRHEPLQALASGLDGLDDIRKIVTQARTHLYPSGWLLLEHGYDQATAVRGLLLDAGFTDVQSRPDLSGIERCSGGRMPRG